MIYLEDKLSGYIMKYVFDYTVFDFVIKIFFKYIILFYYKNYCFGLNIRKYIDQYIHYFGLYINLKYYNCMYCCMLSYKHNILAFKL